MLISSVSSSAEPPSRQIAQGDFAAGNAAFRQHIDRFGSPSSTQQSDVRSEAERTARQQHDAATAVQDEELDVSEDECGSICTAEPSAADDKSALSQTGSWPAKTQMQAKPASALDEPEMTEAFVTSSVTRSQTNATPERRRETEILRLPSVADTRSAAPVTLDNESGVPRADIPDHREAAPPEGLKHLVTGISVTSGQAAHRTEGSSTAHSAFMANIARSGDGDNRPRHGSSAAGRVSSQEAMEQPSSPIRQSGVVQTTVSSLPVIQSLGAFGPVPISLSSGISERDLLTEELLRMELQRSGDTAGRSAVEGVLPQFKQAALLAAGQNQAAALRMQLITHIRLGNSHTISLQLSPVELGSVQISMTMTDAGMQMLFQVERPETLDLLRRFSADLAQDLRNAGFDMLDLSFAHKQPDPKNQNTGPEPNFVDVSESNNRPEARRASILSLRPEGRMDLRL